MCVHRIGYHGTSESQGMRSRLLALLTVLLLFTAPHVQMPPDELRDDGSSRPMASSLDVGNFSRGGYHLVTGEWWESPSLNSGTALSTTPIWTSSDFLSTFSVAWGDVDGDGDLDLARGNYAGNNEVYLNNGTALATTPAWTSNNSMETYSVAWGDLDGDGDLDLAVGN
ncbi:MAG: FG-GAP-like repeat-containing protein, partial [Candidatus Poseidoniaceae archaeon]|nr:FG-GAP-like repeat-containing protein [Candidatus Poseidoniaceae archaeon]